MKKFLSMILAIATVSMYLLFPALAASTVNAEEEMLEINGVYIPVTAECEQDGTATIYYNFYDSVNDMHYSFYNTETGEHFAMSGPRYETVGEGARAVEVVAHDYSFDARYTVNGKNNGITFELPEKTIYIQGRADTRLCANDTITSDEHEGGYNYTIEVRQDKFWFPQSVTFSEIAGKWFHDNFSANGGTYYLIIQPVDRLEDWEDIEGDGTLYYYN